MDSSYGIKKIPTFIEESTRVEKTAPGKVGILVNGVDILSYKSKSYCYYGKIEKIDILAGGSDYDVINPPNIIISDTVGSGATATASIIGTLNSIEVLDSGYDFIGEPLITIMGGNGRGARAKANLRSEKTAFVDVSSGAGIFQHRQMLLDLAHIIDLEMVVCIQFKRSIGCRYWHNFRFSGKRRRSGQ